ncbi:MAG: BlaI/MecI/CopY family transcriptional regulator [Lachnospiraceae bacterium]|nr:BlaI/MecI/CopY family transcriptional regulator [Lachnospiraceae bacterium]
MTEYKLGVVESRFADIVWNNEPLTSGELVKLCAQELEWKKSTTYTVLKKLCDKGLFVNDNGTVRAVMTREEYFAAQSRQFVEETFEGSLPAFISAFSSGRKLSAKEVAEIRSLLDHWAGGDKEGS